MPNNIEAVMRFIHDDASVRSMREELWRAFVEEKGVSKEWFIKYVNEAVRRDLVTQTRSKKFRWIGTIASFFIPGADLLKDIAVAGAEELGGDLIEGSGKQRFRWYYTLQNDLQSRKGSAAGTL